MNLKPLNDKVILEPIAGNETTASGIVLPDTAEKDKTQKGKVLAVGPGKLNDSGSRVEIGVAEGDTVIFKEYGPDEVKIDGQEYLIVSAEDIMAIIK